MENNKIGYTKHKIKVFHILLLSMLGVFVLPPLCNGEEAYTNTIMHPDRETRLAWIRSYEMAPAIDLRNAFESERPFKSSLTLLNHLNYIPSERDQGRCGNCWAWAGTGVLGIALHVDGDIFDRLSMQFISSCNQMKACCQGGWLSDLSSFYQFEGFIIPWSNSNAGWQDGDGVCDVPCGNISLTPDYAISSIGTRSITTHGVGQTMAVANIKNVLNQNNAVWFGFFMGTQEDWSRFYAFWNQENEAAVWDFDSTCNKPYTSSGGGHAVLCVGYNDDEASNAYWIMLNSWGVTSRRPNGIFRVAMDMDYDCADTTLEYNLFWQTLDVEFDVVTEVLYVEPSGSCGGHTPCYKTIQEAIGAAGITSTIKVAGGQYDEALTLNKSKTLSLEGGWGAAFKLQSSVSTVNSIQISKGVMTVESINCR